MNIKLFNLIHDFVGRYKILDVLGIFLAEYLLYILIIAFIVLALLEKNWRSRLYQFFLGALSVLLARGIIVETIRYFYQSPRPYITLVFKPLIGLDFSNSFPSGHASTFFALAMAVFLFNRKWGYYFFIAAILNGLARIYVGIHWPTDILGGMAVGILSALIIWQILPKINQVYI